MESCLKLLYRRWWTAGRAPLKQVRHLLDFTLVHGINFYNSASDITYGCRLVSNSCIVLCPGVTAIRPEELEFPNTMTDIDYDTWMLR